MGIIVYVITASALLAVIKGQMPEECLDCGCCLENNCSAIDKVCELGCVGGYWGDHCANKCPSSCENCSGQPDAPGGIICHECVDGYHNTTNNCSFFCPTRCTACTSTSQCSLCANGFYNNNVVKDCSLECPQDCVHCYSTVVCSGPWPQKCENEPMCPLCKKGHYNPPLLNRNCSLICPFNCVSCLSDTACLSCRDGYYNSDSVKDCSLTCPYRCASCTSPEVCTGCIEGYYNNNTVSDCSIDYQCPSRCKGCTSGIVCTDCVEGFYKTETVTDCRIPCPDQCRSCVSADICTSCEDGFFSGHAKNDTSAVYNDCRFRCPHGCHSCSSFDVCPECEPNFSGQNCGECIKGKYGTDCEDDCPQNCENNKCNRQSGECISCKVNFYGFPNCDSVCNASCAPTSTEQSRCDEISGICHYGCIPGYSGIMCEIPCSKACVNSTCDRYGKCTLGCKPGYRDNGSMCTKVTDTDDTDNIYVWKVIAGVVGGAIILGIIALVLIRIAFKRDGKNNAKYNAKGKVKDDDDDSEDPEVPQVHAQVGPEGNEPDKAGEQEPDEEQVGQRHKRPISSQYSSGFVNISDGKNNPKYKDELEVPQVNVQVGPEGSEVDKAGEQEHAYQDVNEEEVEQRQRRPTSSQYSSGFVNIS